MHHEQQLPLDLFGEPPIPTPPPAETPPHAQTPRTKQPLPPISAEALTRDAQRRLKELARTEARIATLIPRIRVIWYHRLQNSAGRAHFQDSRIELNPRLATLSDPSEIERTLLHELAHLLSWHRSITKADGTPLSRPRKIDAHGPEWRQACTDLGIPNEPRCHTLELAPRRKVKPKYAFICPHCKEHLLRVRPLARHSACAPCCKRHNKGKFDARYEFVPIPLQDALHTLALRENGM